MGALYTCVVAFYLMSYPLSNLWHDFNSISSVFSVAELGSEIYNKASFYKKDVDWFNKLYTKFEFYWTRSFVLRFQRNFSNYLLAWSCSKVSTLLPIYLDFFFLKYFDEFLLNECFIFFSSPPKFPSHL